MQICFPTLPERPENIRLLHKRYFGFYYKSLIFHTRIEITVNTEWLKHISKICLCRCESHSRFSILNWNLISSTISVHNCAFLVVNNRFRKLNQWYRNLLLCFMMASLPIFLKDKLVHFNLMTILATPKGLKHWPKER